MMASLWARIAISMAAICFSTSATSYDVQKAEDTGNESSDTTEAIPQVIPTEHFAGRSAFNRPRLSPDGTMIGLIRDQPDGAELITMNLDSRTIVGAAKVEPDYDIEWFRWAGNEKIIISVSTLDTYDGEDARFTRMSLHYPATNENFWLGPRTAVLEGDNVIHVDDEGRFALVAIQRTVYEYPSVMRYDLERDGDIKRIEKPRDGVWNWYADDNGVVRMGTGWLRKRLRVYYRPDAGSKLELVGKLRENDDSRFWDVAQIISGSNQGYVLEEGENGRTGIRLFDYSTGEVVETVYENPNWDIDRVWFRKGKPLAAFYTDDREQVVWFDSEYEKLYARLGSALKTEEVWVVSRSEDGKRMLVWAGSEADPGVLYLYSPDEKRLEQLAEYRPKLDFRLLVKPKPVKYTARDGTEISAYLTLPRGREPSQLPLIILPHGGPYGVRDLLSYNDEVQLLANRGYAVLQPNFRGSGGFGEAFFELGTGQIGRGMQDDLDDGMDWLVAQGIADPTRVCVVGASYGGYAAIWSVMRNPERYRCAASWAGVTDWNRMLRYDRRYFSRNGAKKWRARVEGDDDFDLDLVSPFRSADKLSRPVLLAHGTDDSNVPFRQYRDFERATRDAPVPPTTLVVEGEGHGFSSAESEKRWYDSLVNFLAEHNPAD